MKPESYIALVPNSFRWNEIFNDEIRRIGIPSEKLIPIGSTGTHCPWIRPILNSVYVSDTILDNNYSDFNRIILAGYEETYSPDRTKQRFILRDMTACMPHVIHVRKKDSSLRDLVHFRRELRDSMGFGCAYGAVKWENKHSISAYTKAKEDFINLFFQIPRPQQQEFVTMIL